jgi:hypothetical protein
MRIKEAIKEDLAQPQEQSPNSQRPAYPTNGRMHSEMVGLSKRELFAAMILQNMAEFGSWDIRDEVVKRSVDFADELIKQLER